MNDEIKEILISLTEYYKSRRTPQDFSDGSAALENIVARATRALEQEVRKKQTTNRNSSDVDPFVTPRDFPAYKLEDEW